MATSTSGAIRRALGLFLASCLLTGASRAKPTASAGLFDRATMKAADLGGLKAWLGQPVQVTGQVSWGTQTLDAQGKMQMSFAHYFPGLAKFPGGNLIATYALDSDSQDDPVFISGWQISRDGGRAWGRRYSLIMQHNPMVFVPRTHDSLLAIPSELVQQTVGDERNFTGPGLLFEEGGKRIVILPDGVRLVNWPWPVDVAPNSQPQENWHVGLCLTGNVLPAQGGVLATIYGRKKGARYYDTMLILSRDEGATWRYYATVASPDPALEGQKRYEGPCESTVIRLADGDLMAAFRVGSGPSWNLRRNYSHDGGRTWGPTDALPAYSVMPSMLRLANGVIALSTGRPGIDLWLSADPRAAAWQKVDIIAHHNSCESDPTYRISRHDTGDYTQWETTAYTKLVEIAPNRMLLIYERDAIIRPPERAPTSREDRSRVFVLPIEIER